MTEEKRPKARAEFLITCQHCQGRFRSYLTRLQLKQYIKDIDKEQKKLDKEFYRLQIERRMRENAQAT